MSLHFRRYKDSRKMNDYFFGIVCYDRNQPTLDIIIGNNVFVAFWKRKEQ